MIPARDRVMIQVERTCIKLHARELKLPYGGYASDFNAGWPDATLQISVESNPEGRAFIADLGQALLTAGYRTGEILG